MLLASCNVCIITISSFSHAERIATFQTLKKKQQTWTDRYDRLRLFPSLSLDSPPVVTSVKYVCYLYDDNKLQV